MSVKLMAQVWERKLNKAEQSVLLAMADHAQDDGSKCFPSVDWIAWKTDYSARQVQRTIKALCAKGVLVLLRGYGRGRANEYHIDLSKTTAKPEYISKGDTMSPLTQKHDTTSPQSIKGDTMSPQIDVPGKLKGDILSVKGDIHDIKGDIAMSPEPLEPPIQPKEEEKETHASDPLSVAWRQAYGDATMPPKLATSLRELVTECGMAAAIHGIKASATKKDSRNFKYIAECARNYVPPTPNSNYANGPSYHIDLPGVHVMAPATNGHLPTPLPPPMAHDDPWAICLAELAPGLTSVGESYLKGSVLELVGEQDGKPVYRVVVEERAASGVGWLTAQVGPSIRRRLGSILRQSVNVEIVAAETEQESQHERTQF